MADKDIYNTYHNLWRIEKSFKVMKSDLDARPVFLQKEDTIKGHFLICYITVLLERIFQFKVLEDKYSTSEIFNFIKDFKAIKTKVHILILQLIRISLMYLQETNGTTLNTRDKQHPIQIYNK